MSATLPLVDIHCHIIPGVDDGPRSWQESLAMASIASAEGIDTVIATPHQLGNYGCNGGELIRERARELARTLRRSDIAVRVLPGADVRIEPDLAAKIRSGDVVTLGDHHKHLLLELPRELYFRLEPVLDELTRDGIQGVLSHPERNQGLLARPELIGELVNNGCLMQVTAGSLLGAFGQRAQRLARWMVQNGLVHFVASDAHGIKSRRPLLKRAFRQVEVLAGFEWAREWFCENPARVAAGQSIAGGQRSVRTWRMTNLLSRFASA